MSKQLNFERMTPEERNAFARLYVEQLETWREYWGDEPDYDTKRIFACRARHDALAGRGR